MEDGSRRMMMDVVGGWVDAVLSRWTWTRIVVVVVVAGQAEVDGKVDERQPWRRKVSIDLTDLIGWTFDPSVSSLEVTMMLMTLRLGLAGVRH